jgi:Ca2+-binding RTX toxin-like protein
MHRTATPGDFMTRQSTAFDPITDDLTGLHGARNDWNDAWVSPATAHPAVALPQIGPGAHGAHTLIPFIPGSGQHSSAAAAAALHHDDPDQSALNIAPTQIHAVYVPSSLTPAVITSPSMADEVAFISGIDAGGNVVGTSFWTWNNDNPATYATRSDVHKWGTGTAATAGGTINYYFDTGSSWTATEKAQMTACLTLWSDIANIHFALTTSSAAADITFERGSDGQAVTFANWSGGSSAGDIGGASLWSMTGATISLDTSVPGFGPMDGNFASIGGYVWQTILHEEGHALGLGHAGGYNGNVDATTQQYSQYDSRLWSIMSYIDPSVDAKYSGQYPVSADWGRASDGYLNVPTTPMILDDLAIQGLYGASTAAALSGGQTFGFHCNIADSTEQFYDFTVNTNPVVTIWDSGTGNTLDLSGYSTASTINLNPGTFSSAHGMTSNIGIAFGTKIDAADGGAGNDTIIANTDADHVFGGAGNDTLNFGASFMEADRINGGAGTDTLDLNGDYGAGVRFDTVTMINVEKVVLAAGHDYNLIPSDNTVAAGKTLTVTAGALGTANRFTFNGVNEKDGSFILKGGQGTDIITGGAGNDNIDGGPGSDHLRGGAGNDTFTYLAVHDSMSTTRDLIFDFDAAHDKIDLWYAVSSIHAAIHTGTLSSGSFDSQLAVAVSGLASHQAVLFTPNAGNLVGHTFLVVDANGTPGYQVHADLVIDLEQPTNIGSFGMSTFI